MAKLKLYEYNNQKQANVESISCLLGRTLYSKRFFPFYTFNLLCGFDKNNNGIVYGYDAIGSYDSKNYMATGSG